MGANAPQELMLVAKQVFYFERYVKGLAPNYQMIKDLYLTAEAIGEANVDKHFDQLLAQQRELISDYFQRSGVAGPAEEAQPASSADQAETDPGARRDPGPPPGAQPSGGPATPPEGVRVAADRPRAW